MSGFEADREITPGGVPLRYAELGEGRPIVLVHGNGESHAIFDVLAAELAARGRRVLAPDSRGQGANEPLDEYHYADMAEDMYLFIRALGLEKPVLYGFSDGGIIGLLLASKHPGTLGALAVSGANLSPDGLVPEFLKEVGEQNAQHPEPLVTLMLTEPRIEARELAHIDVPVLVTAGEHDLILPEETRRIAGSIPDSELVIVPGADHGGYVEHSPVIGGLLCAFLERRGL